MWITAMSHALPPVTNGGDGKCRSVMVQPPIHPAGVVGHIVDAIGDGLALAVINEVVHQDSPGMSLPLPLFSPLPEGTYQFLLLGIHRNDGLSLGLESLYLSGNVAELRVPVWVLLPFFRLAVGLQAITQLMQHVGYSARADGMPLLPKSLCEVRSRADPSAGWHLAWKAVSFPLRGAAYDQAQVGCLASILASPCELWGGRALLHATRALHLLVPAPWPLWQPICAAWPRSARCSVLGTSLR
jgi:hypothetical protein